MRHTLKAAAPAGLLKTNVMAVELFLMFFLSRSPVGSGDLHPSIVLVSYDVGVLERCTSAGRCCGETRVF